MDGQMDRSVLRAAWSQLKIQYDHQAAILKVTSLKNKMFLPTATSTRNLKLKFQSKLELCSRNHATYRVYKWKIQYGCQAAILKMTVTENQWAFLPMATINMHMKFEVEIPKQTLKTMLSTDRQTDKMNPVYIPPSNFIGWGYNEKNFGQICTHERHPIACP